MGQTIGRAPLPQKCLKFLNLPKRCIYELWTAFNDIAEGFGLSIEEFNEILKNATLEYLQMTERNLAPEIDAIFRALDDDENKLVDSLEFIASMAMLSGMTPEEKVRFLFAMYDFDESGVLTLDEMVLAFRSSLSGACKLCHIDPPFENDIENTVGLAFDSLQMSNNPSATESSVFSGIDRETFVLFCLNTPDVIAWIDFFDDLLEYHSERPMIVPPITALEQYRYPEDEAFMNQTLGGLEKLRLEKEVNRGGPIAAWRNAMPLLNAARGAVKGSTRPSKNLSLEWIYGYTGHSGCKQNIFYSAVGEVIYPAAAIVVVQNVAQHEQRFFNQHHDLVTALASFVDGEDSNSKDQVTIVASGERGYRPCIFIWDCTTLTIISTLVGFHRGGVAALNFSPNKEKLVSLGMDPYHSLAVYRWRTSERLFTARTSPHPVYDIRYLTEDIIGSCGKGHVMFWRRDKLDRYKRYRGQGTATFKPEDETFHVIGSLGNGIVYTGTENGYVQIWEGRNWMRSIKAHTGAIHATTSVGKTGMITACGSGKVLIWSEAMEIIATFNMTSLGPIQPGVVAVCYDAMTSRILIGLRTCEIYEVDATDGRNLHAGGSIISGHYHPRLCGVTAHPFNANLLCTVGDDKTIRIFDINERKQQRICQLDSKAHAVAYANKGQAVLIGIGSGFAGHEEPKEGAYLYINPEDLTLLHEARDAKKVITDVKFSPDGERFALACGDGCIYLYHTAKMISYAICRGHTGSVTHIDYSANGQFLMSNSSTGELLFWEVAGGQLQAPKAVKAVKWETNTCVYSFGTQGMIGDVLEERYITACCACRTRAEDFIAIGDSMGVISTSQYPCYVETAGKGQGQSSAAEMCYYRGHSKGISAMTMSCDDKLLLTVGETDGCLFQWKIKEMDANLNENDLKRIETASGLLQTELAYDGKALDHQKFYEDALNGNITAIYELEEGIQEAKNMMPWQKVIVAPSKTVTEDITEPPDHLELDYIYGLSTDTSRQALQYTAKGEIAFFVSTVAVLMTQSTRNQRFYRQHGAFKITSMAVNKTSDPNSVDHVIATADLQNAARILIWSIETLKTVVCLRGYHRRGVSHMRFSTSNEGKYLATIGMDTFHSLAVYDWKNMTLITCAPTMQAKVLAMDWNPNSTGLLVTGHETVRFWTVSGRNVASQDGVLTSRAKLQSFLCIGWIGGNAVVGTADGNLYRFLTHRLESIVTAHNGPVTAIATGTDGLVSCGQDGLVKVWTRFLECRMIIEMKNIRAVSNQIRALDWDWSSGRLLLGTSAAEIFEVSAADGENIHRGALLEGHGGDGELWGLAVNPTREEFVTVGDDCLLRIWDLATRQAVSTMALEMPARCVAYSPDGKKIAVGFGCPRKVMDRQFDGKWIVLDTIDMQISHEARDSSKWLHELKYSPNGNFIAIGGEDCKIYVYNVLEGYNLVATIGNHQSYITSFDFSDDSAWLRSNCGGLELLYFEAETGLFIPAAARLRDVNWCSQNITMDWSVQGIWSPYRDGVEYTACEANSFRGDDGQIAVIGDNFGRLRVVRYPCTSSTTLSKHYTGGSHPITRIRFASGDGTLVTINGHDKAIFVWKHHRDRDDTIAFQTGERRGLLEEEEDDVSTWLLLFSDSQGNVELVLAGELQQLVSTRPWLGSMVEPSNALQWHATPTDLHHSLLFSHVLGLQVNLTRHGVRYSNAHDVVYPTSRYAVIYNKKSNRQIFYAQHEFEICCLTVSVDGKLAASVERSLRPVIHIWDANTAQPIAILPAIHRRGVLHLQFSSDRKSLVSIGADDDHSLALWQSSSGTWSDGQLFTWVKGDAQPVLFAAFHEVISHDKQLILVTGGRFHLKFWCHDGHQINPLYAEYGKQVKLGTMLCGHSLGASDSGGKKFASGSTAGHIYLWTGRKLDRIIRAHEKGITAIISFGSSVITSSKDGAVKVWTMAFEHVRTFSLAEADVPPLKTIIRSLDCISDATGALHTVLASTSSGEVYEIFNMSGRISLLLEAHYEGELRGLAMHPIDPDVFVTVGDDQTIRIWSISERRVLRKAVIDCTARCCAFSPDGTIIIVGLGGRADGTRQRKDGAFLVLDGATLKPKYEGRDSRHWVTEIRFSPDGHTFAVASMDHKVYLYAADSIRLRGTCDKHNGSVLHLDFSVDNIYLQSNSKDYEHLFFETSDGQHFTAGSQLRDMQWHDWTAIFGWPVQGIWPAMDDNGVAISSDPKSAHRSVNQQLLVAGDMTGHVKLTRYPCLNKRSPRMTCRGHVGEVGKVRFNCDMSTVVSIGEKDRSIIIWNVLRSHPSSGSGGQGHHTDSA